MVVPCGPLIDFLRPSLPLLRGSDSELVDRRASRTEEPVKKDKKTKLHSV